MEIYYRLVCVQCNVKNKQLIKNEIKNGTPEDKKNMFDFIDYHARHRMHHVMVSNDGCLLHEPICDKYLLTKDHNDSIVLIFENNRYYWRGQQ